MEKSGAMSEAWLFACDFEKRCDEYAEELLNILKRGCRTYSEVDQRVEILRRDARAWASKKSLHLIAETTKKILEQEKGRLLVADGPLRKD